MARRIRKHLFIVLASFLVFFTAMLITLILSLDLNSYRPRLQQTLSQAMGVQIQINGNLGLSLKPDLALTMQDVSFSQGERQLANIDQASVFIALLPLLEQVIEIEGVTLEHSRLDLNASYWPIAITRTTETSTPASGDKEWSWKLKQHAFFRLRNSQLLYTIADKSWSVQLDDFDLRIRTHELTSAMFQNRGLDAMELRGTLRGAGLVTPWATLDEPRAEFALLGQNLELKGIRAQVFGGRAEGDFHLKLVNPGPEYELRFTLKELEAAQSINRLARQGLVEGKMQLTADLNWQGKSPGSMIASLDGSVSLHGKDLLLKKVDLDKSFEAFEKSQHFNLVDLGAYFFMGPMGTVATKGYSFAKLINSTNGGPSHIQQLVSDWKVEDGVVTAEDVAFSTLKNRLAVQGRLDLVHAQYDRVIFAIVDKNGCARFSQKISGPLQSPVIEPPKKLEVLTAPIREVLDIPRKLLGSGKCSPFYMGSLPHPTNPTP